MLRMKEIRASDYERERTYKKEPPKVALVALVELQIRSDSNPEVGKDASFDSLA